MNDGSSSTSSALKPVRSATASLQWTIFPLGTSTMRMPWPMRACASRTASCSAKGSVATPQVSAYRAQSVGLNGLDLVPLEQLLAYDHALNLACALPDEEQRRVAI